MSTKMAAPMAAISATKTKDVDPCEVEVNV